MRALSASKDAATTGSSTASAPITAPSLSRSRHHLATPPTRHCNPCAGRGREESGCPRRRGTSAGFAHTKLIQEGFMLRRRALLGLLGTGVVAAAVLAVGIAGAAPPGGPPGQDHTKTPIKHLVVIFQENVSFDHYFGTYPTAANTD